MPRRRGSVKTLFKSIKIVVRLNKHSRLEQFTIFRIKMWIVLESCGSLHLLWSGKYAWLWRENWPPLPQNAGLRLAKYLGPIFIRFRAAAGQVSCKITSDVLLLHPQERSEYCMSSCPPGWRIGQVKSSCAAWRNNTMGNETRSKWGRVSYVLLVGNGHQNAKPRQAAQFLHGHAFPFGFCLSKEEI